MSFIDCFPRAFSSRLSLQMVNDAHVELTPMLPFSSYLVTHGTHVARHFSAAICATRCLGQRSHKSHARQSTSNISSFPDSSYPILQSDSMSNDDTGRGQCGGCEARRIFCEQSMKSWSFSNRVRVRLALTPVMNESLIWKEGCPYRSEEFGTM